jgi:hypothetical protein
MTPFCRGPTLPFSSSSQHGTPPASLHRTQNNYANGKGIIPSLEMLNTSLGGRNNGRIYKVSSAVIELTERSLNPKMNAPQSFETSVTSESFATANTPENTNNAVSAVDFNIYSTQEAP